MHVPESLSRYQRRYRLPSTASWEDVYQVWVRRRSKERRLKKSASLGLATGLVLFVWLHWIWLAVLVTISVTYTAERSHGECSQDVIIDSLSVDKIWLTWDMVIYRELNFSKGDMVTCGSIDTAIRKSWNIGMVAAVTIKPWLVQILEVALERRMCCSRACRVSE